MTIPTKSDVISELSTVEMSEFGLTADDIVADLQISKQGATAVLDLTLNVPPEFNDDQVLEFENKTKQSLMQLGQFSAVNVNIIGHSPEPEETLSAKEEIKEGLQLDPKKKDDKPLPKPEVKTQVQKQPKNVILVSSENRGAGTSFFVGSLAMVMASQHHGLKVGAAVNAPTLSRDDGIRSPMERNEAGMVRPSIHNGVAMAYMGAAPSTGRSFITNTPETVDWGDLDLLLVDVPAGKQEVLWQLQQNMNVKGGVLLTTPDKPEIANGIGSLLEMNIPIIGSVNNMAPSNDPKFMDKDGPDLEAAKYGVRQLGQVPLDPELKGRDPLDPHNPHPSFDPQRRTENSYTDIGYKLVPFLAL